MILQKKTFLSRTYMKLFNSRDPVTGGLAVMVGWMLLGLTRLSGTYFPSFPPKTPGTHFPS